VKEYQEFILSRGIIHDTDRAIYALPTVGTQVTEDLDRTVDGLEPGTIENVGYTVTSPMSLLGTKFHGPRSCRN